MAQPFEVQLRRASDMLALDFTFFGVDRHDRMIWPVAGESPHVVVRLASQYLAEDIHDSTSAPATWSAARTWAARPSQIAIDLTGALPRAYDPAALLDLLTSRPSTVWPTPLPDTADPTLEFPSADYPATFLELSHGLILSPYAGAGWRIPRPPGQNPDVSEIWQIVLNEAPLGAGARAPYGDRGKLRAVKSREPDRVSETLPATSPPATSNYRKQLVDLTNYPGASGNEIAATALRLSALGASGQMAYDRYDAPSGYDLVLWRKDLSVRRVVGEQRAIRGVLWPWMLRCILQTTTQRWFFNTAAGARDYVGTLLTKQEIILKDRASTFPGCDASFPWTKVEVDPGFTTTGSISLSKIADVQSTAAVRDAVQLPLRLGTAEEYGFPLTLYDRAKNAHKGHHPGVFIPDFNGTASGGNDPGSFKTAFDAVAAVWKTRSRNVPAAAAVARSESVTPGAVRWLAGAGSNVLLRCIRGGVTAAGPIAAAGGQYVTDGEVVWQQVRASLCDLLLNDAPVALVDPPAAGSVDIALPALTVSIVAPLALDGAGAIAAAATMEQASVAVAALRDLGENPYTAIQFTNVYQAAGDFRKNAGEVFARLVPDALVRPDIARVDPRKLAENAVLAFPTAGLAGLSRTVGAVLGDVSSEAAVAKCLTDAIASQFDPKNVFAGLRDTLPSLFGFIPLASVLRAGGLDDAAPKIRRIVSEATAARTIVATYDYQTAIDPFGPIKKGGSLAFTVTVTTTIPLGGGQPTVSQSLSCTISGITLGLLEGVIELADVSIDTISFRSASGAPSTFAMDGLHVELTGAMAYIAELAQQLGSGSWSIGPVDGGFLAAFEVKARPVTLGAFSITGLSFSSGLKLPFDGNPMRFMFALATRMHPFSLMVGIYGGGGFAEIDITPPSATRPLRVALDVALEFRGGFDLDLGVASGSVYLAAGIWFEIAGGNTSLAGYVRCGGCLDVLGIISISVQFYLALGYSGGVAWGECEVVVEISILFFSASVGLKMRKEFAGSAQPVQSQPFSALLSSDAAQVAPSTCFADYVSFPEFQSYLRFFEV